MSNKKDCIKFLILRKDETIDYQSVIEERFGMEISKLSCYDANIEHDPKYNAGVPYGPYSEAARAYFNPEVDYEIIIRPVNKKK